MSDPKDPVHQLRAQLKELAASVLALRDGMPPGQPQGEAIANVMLAYRHLEDASMRLGKVIQALDGGVSVYDQRETVGT